MVKLDKLKVGHVIIGPQLKGKWVVTQSKSTRMPGPHTEPAFNVWEIGAKKLKRDGSFNDWAPEKKFYDCSMFDGYLPDGVEIVKRMKRVTTYVEVVKKVKQFTFEPYKNAK